MIYIGIDPGKNGGIAAIYTENRMNLAPVIEVHKYSDNDLLEIIGFYHKFIKNCEAEVCCILEQVHARPKQGVTSTFNFGMNYGFIQGVLRANDIPFELVPPQKWKKEFSCTSDKNTSIDVCKRLFPNVNLKASERCKKDHDGMAEALLMAEYGRRHYNGES